MPQGAAAQGAARGSGGQGFLEVPQHHLLVGLEKGELEEASLLPVPPPPKHHPYTKAAPGLTHEQAQCDIRPPVSDPGSLLVPKKARLGPWRWP